MSVPAFIELPENEQVLELRSYLKGLGAEISEESSAAGYITDIVQLVSASEKCFTEASNDTDIESVFNSIISLILIVPSDNSEDLIISLCEKLAKIPPGDKQRGPIRTRLLQNLFNGLDERSPGRYVVYYSLVKLAGQTKQIEAIPHDLTQIKKWVAQWDVSTEKVQQLLRALHDAFVECKQTDKGTKTMIELLGTYTEDNASQARDDAQRCIVTSLRDPTTFLLDHLLTLKPVKFLEGELIHNLLTIFVSGKVSDYLQFYQTNTDTVNSLGLRHEDNLKKMQILTFMQMAEQNKEIDFATIEQEMRLGPDDVESFIIEVVRTKAVRVRMDQVLSQYVYFSCAKGQVYVVTGKQVMQRIMFVKAALLFAVINVVCCITVREMQCPANRVLSAVQSVMATGLTAGKVNIYMCCPTGYAALYIDGAGGFCCPAGSGARCLSRRCNCFDGEIKSPSAPVVVKHDV
ncbi:unnamed protein product [Owenia fusiformis]|uniref:Eukaryotic translation initiation factor 3 subunit M n=1 Tax=Owenia fusiformis TaxID=6347 RepID=A0A8J1V1K5_OWEFU|nr:unnamed protein product [Owenia fusiformis]